MLNKMENKTLQIHISILRSLQITQPYVEIIGLCIHKRKLLDRAVECPRNIAKTLYTLFNL